MNSSTTPELWFFNSALRLIASNLQVLSMELKMTELGLDKKTGHAVANTKSNLYMSPF